MASDAIKLAPIGQGGPRTGAGRKPASATTTDSYAVLAAARAKRESFRAELAELEYREATRTLLPADEVAAAWTERIGVAKSRFLALPARLAPELLGARDLRTIEAALRDAIISVLEELAGGTSGH